MRNFDCDVTVQTEVQYSFTKGFKDYFDKSFGNWLPGEPDEVTEIKVLLNVDFKALEQAINDAKAKGITSGMVAVNITHTLNNAELEAIYDEATEHSQEE